MASKQMVMLAVTIAVAVAFLPALGAATEHTVGDDKGWRLGFNYTAWAETKNFKVGDTLLFKYNQASHTVVEVSGDEFKTCRWPDNANAMSTGQDQVALDSPGRRWFVCSVGMHCMNGMKVRIDVADDNAVSPAAPPPTGHAPQVHARLAQAVLVIAAVAAVLVL